MSSSSANSPTESALHRRLYELQALHDIAREIAPLQQVDAIVREAALTMVGTLGTQWGVAVLTTPAADKPQRVFDMGLPSHAREDLDGALDQYPNGLAEITQVYKLAPAEQDPLAAALYRAGGRLWLPLRVQQGASGGLCLGERLADAAYEDDDLRLLDTVQSLVQQALHNAELYRVQQAANAELARLNQALEVRVQDRTEALDAARDALSQGDQSVEFIGQSKVLLQVQNQLRDVADTDLTVLILGETGTGKGLVAQTLHQLSPRRVGPFIQINCGALPKDLVESELFGHEKGAFTGAHARKIGKIELASGGTLFLDEIGDMPLEAQVKLLRLLEERVFERVGGTQTMPTQVRVVAATNLDLEAQVADKRFREDLFFRLKVFPVELPPLRARGEDILLLARFAVERFAQRLHRPVPALAPAALQALQNYGWPGNVRELEHVLQRAVLICQRDCIEATDLALTQTATAPVEGEIVSLAANEKRHLERALAVCDGAIYGASGAAQLLNVHPETLRYRLKKHGLLTPRRRGR